MPAVTEQHPLDRFSNIHLVLRRHEATPRSSHPTSTLLRATGRLARNLHRNRPRVKLLRRRLVPQAEMQQMPMHHEPRKRNCRDNHRHISSTRKPPGSRSLPPFHHRIQHGDRPQRAQPPNRLDTRSTGSRCRSNRGLPPDRTISTVQQIRNAKSNAATTRTATRSRDCSLLNSSGRP